MDSMYGPMSWIRLHAAGKQVIALTTSPRTQADHLLAQPFDAHSLSRLLQNIADGKGMAAPEPPSPPIADTPAALPPKATTPAAPPPKATTPAAPPSAATPAPAPADQLPEELPSAIDEEAVAPRSSNRSPHRNRPPFPRLRATGLSPTG